MAKHSTTPEDAPSPAGFAGSLRRLWLILLIGGMTLAGAAAGIMIDRFRTATDLSVTQAKPSEPEMDASEKNVAPPPPVIQHGSEPANNDAEEAAGQTLTTKSATSTPATSADPLVEANSSSAGPFKDGAPDSEMSAENITEPAQEPTGPEPNQILARGDAYLLEGNYSPALEAYSRIVNKVSSARESQIRFRMALCEEAIGNLQQAQFDYRRVVELQPPGGWSEAAILGQARIWEQSSRRELATGQLFRFLLEGAHQRQLSIQSQLPHQLAILLSSRVKGGADSTRELNALNVELLTLPRLSVYPHEILHQLLANASDEEREPVGLVDSVAVVQQFGPSPDEVFLNLQMNRLPVLEILRRISQTTSWQFQLTDEARQLLQERTLKPASLDLSLAIVLDAVLDPFDLVWRAEEGMISICRAAQANPDQLSQYRLNVAQRMLRFAIAFAPDHRWTAASYLELGRIAAVSGELETAALSLEQLVDQYPRSDFTPIGHLNLGKIRLRQGQLDAALPQFLRAADLLGGMPLEPVAYLFAGRVHLEHQQTRDAIMPLTRGLALAEGTSVEPVAAVTLSSAYYLLEHYQRANEILMEHQKSLNRGNDFQDQAAFLASLIHFRAERDERLRSKEGARLIGALTMLEVPKAFGGHWWLLAGTAYRDTGMASQEIALLQQSLQSGYAYPLQNEIRLMLLRDAPVVPSGVARNTNVGTTPALQLQSLLMDATLAYRRGEFDAALRNCRSVFDHSELPPDLRKDSLKLLGRIYQAQGDYERAVQCHSGVLPEHSMDSVPASNLSAKPQENKL